MKHDVSRNTLKLWMTKLSVRTLVDNKQQAILSSMKEEQKDKDCKNEIKLLTKSARICKTKDFEP